MMKTVVIGAGGFGREVADLAAASGLKVVGFIDRSERGEPVPGIPVLGGDDLIPGLVARGTAEAALVAIGDGRVRQRLLDVCGAAGLELPAIVHASASVLTRHPIGEGAILYPGVVVMTDCVIGRGVLLNSGATLGHDVVLGVCSNINPGAHLAGRVVVGARSMVGIGASIRENITIGADVIVGAGSVVVKDLPDGVVAYGVPAVPVAGRGRTHERTAG